MTVGVQLSSALRGDVTIPVTFRRGTSEPGDHGTLSGITVPAGRCCKTAFIETAVDDDPHDETFTVSLGNLPSSVHKGSPSSVTMTIIDDGVDRTGTIRGASLQIQEANTQHSPQQEGLIARFVPEITLSRVRRCRPARR